MAKTTKKTSEKVAPLSRREEVRRALPKEQALWKDWLDRPSFFLSIAIGIGFVILATLILNWSFTQPMAREGQIMFDTFASRIDFDVVDAEKTRQERERARDQAPHVYRDIPGRLEGLVVPLRGLPAAVAGRESLDDVPVEIITQFGLNENALSVLQKWSAEDGASTSEWVDMVDTFKAEQLFGNPFINSIEYAREQIAPSIQIQLHISGPNGDSQVSSNRSSLVNMGEPRNVDDRLNEMIQKFPSDVRPFVLSSLKQNLTDTYQLDEAATTQNQAIAEAAVETQKVGYPKGTVIYTRGTPLTADQLVRLRAEHDQYSDVRNGKALWAERAGMAGLVFLVASIMAGCLGMFRRTVFEKPIRLLVLASMILLNLAMVAALGSALPRVFLGIIVASSLLLAVIVVIAYGRPVALGLGSLFGILACLALQVPIGYICLVIGTLGFNVWQLREIRDRNRLLRAGALTGVGGAFGAISLALVYRPIGADGFGLAMLIDTIGGAGAALFVGIFMLGILSSVERVFNVTTGLTLVELRDPKQPLLRQLLERAPGTWNHSLQVANIAETAAEAIGADSLLTYVGALYHDIGKMNKPAYFIENQTDGENRHARLSPAMSLLIIVGHVKDGIEMAREFGLPKVLHHFIEGHHGTTLVEYFYHAAKEKAEAGQTNDEVNEVEYRYPGPKPRTKETAILMLADAVESASRTLPEKSPSRVKQLVRTIGQKRLLDGQFDECDLTLAELHQVEDSIIKSLNAMYHGRISYPTEVKEEDESTRREAERTSAPATQTG